LLVEEIYNKLGDERLFKEKAIKRPSQLEEKSANPDNNESEMMAAQPSIM